MLKLLRGSAFEVRIPGVVGRKTLGRKQVRLIENGYGGVYGADALHQLCFERDGDRDGG